MPAKLPEHEAGTVELNNGVRMPLVGLGTWKVDDDEGAYAVAYALNVAGYRYVDTAWAYGNEVEIGRGIEASGVPRSELFISGQLWSTWHSRVEAGLDQTLRNLGTTYLDLYLLHWPVALNPAGNHPIYPLLPNGRRDVDFEQDLADTWRQMEDVLRKGKVRAIGVSNCSQKYLEKILEVAEITPAVNQIELHPYNPQESLTKYLFSKGIRPIASSPLGSIRGSPLLKDPTVMEIARKRFLLPSEVLLGWLNFKGIPAVPKSTTSFRLASNLTAPTAAARLTTEDIKRLDMLAAEGKQRRFVTPSWPIDLGFDDWAPASPLDSPKTSCNSLFFEEGLACSASTTCGPVKVSRCGCQYA